MLFSISFYSLDKLLLST